MRIYNYLTRKVEEFKPINVGEVGLYTCGPTVYDFVHIGNWRTFVFEDVLKRTLQFNGYNVQHVMNLTDIDDKIIKRAKEQNVDFTEITDKYAQAFFDSFYKLNLILEPDEPKDLGSVGVSHIRYYPRATEYISEMVNLILKLIEKKIAYKADDGIYFSVEKFPHYGKLSGLRKVNLKKGARVNDDLYDKENWSDFALWKFEKPGEPSWDAPFGKGRPGWHIECSAMSMSILGEHFDIHCGGVDLLFPHHENEIAQAEAATGAKFVNVWMEGEHLLVDGEKMSKSLNNFFKLEDIEQKGFDPLALRYLFLTAHYRSKLNFTWESLQSARNALDNLRQEVSTWDEVREPWEGLSDYDKEFRKAIDEDLDMPKAIAVMWEMVKSEKPSRNKHESLLTMDQVLGLRFDEVKKAVLPKGTQELIDKREQLRKDGKFEDSDKAREELKALGVEVEDTPQGSKWRIAGSQSRQSK